MQGLRDNMPTLFSMRWFMWQATFVLMSKLVQFAMRAAELGV